MENCDIIETVMGNIKIVKYNKPKRKNAIDIPMYLKITQILNEAADDDSIAVAVLTGNGDYYSSGNDLSGMSREHSHLDVLKEFIKAFITFPKLLIAIVNGPAVGIAATTLPLCDLVFAAENAFFLTPFSKLGIVAEGCSTLTFPRVMGDRKAIEMLLLNHKMSAQEALECGFVNYLFKPEELQSKVWDKIVEVSKLPKHSIKATKSLIRNNCKDLLQVNDKELQALQNVWDSGEHLSSLQNFMLEKNKSKI
ncbi:enoyl-CoA delta isomerase 3, peroxisomal [Plutella xylostella]|uniref:enoyl-CoA delta isomerase 3, peroxisomal n=1 Tax=Plutella xylostella TaxID=51655 RepID=UPI002032FDCA|nr:enoyl-CoA delta isomerase 3, peroxisomal [Plutella xylostella]